MRFKIKLQEFQKQLAVSRRHREPKCTDMKGRLFAARVVSFEREGNFDLADGEEVRAQPRAQLFKKPVQNEKQWLQQIHGRIQVHVLFEVGAEFLGDQGLLVRAPRQAPPIKPLLPQPLDNGNFGKSRKFSTSAPKSRQTRQAC